MEVSIVFLSATYTVILVEQPARFGVFIDYVHEQRCE